MMNTHYRVLRPGRVLVDYGPATLTIEASYKGKPLTEIAVSGAFEAMNYVDELSKDLNAARKAICKFDTEQDNSFNPILGEMIRSVRKLDEDDFTPMAAVAGTISDFIKEGLMQKGADRVVVNNGGDIAFYQESQDQPFRVGVISSLETGDITHVIDIHSQQNINGIATSGIGGRSLTKGVASAVTVLAENCSLADAAATAIANATDCNDPVVEKCPAEEIDHFTDIKGHLVTRSVGQLQDNSIKEALNRGLERTRALIYKRMIKGAVIFVQGQMVMLPEKIARPRSEKHVHVENRL